MTEERKFPVTVSVTKKQFMALKDGADSLGISRSDFFAFLLVLRDVVSRELDLLDSKLQQGEPLSVEDLCALRRVIWKGKK